MNILPISTHNIIDPAFIKPDKVKVATIEIVTISWYITTKTIIFLEKLGQN